MSFRDEYAVCGSDGNDFCFGFSNGTFFFHAELMCGAPDRERALRTPWSFAADQRPEFHKSLVVGAGLSVRQKSLGFLTNDTGRRLFFDGGIDIEESGEYPFDIGVDGDDVLFIGYAENGCHRVIPESREGGEGFLRVGYIASVAFRHDFGRLMQKARATVVSEPFPIAEYFLFPCFGNGADIGKTPHPALKVGDTAFHLGLLKHDFGYPYLIGAVMLSPGERTLMKSEPAKQSL